MNEIIRFAKTHPNLYQWCEGSYMFLIPYTLIKWVDEEAINLLGSFQQLAPEDLDEITEWPIKLNFILGCIPEQNRGFAMYPSWWDHYGKNLVYDLFALKFAPEGGFDPDRHEGWLRYMLSKIDDEQFHEHLFRFMGSWANQYPEVVLLQQKIKKRIKNRQIAEEKARVKALESAAHWKILDEEKRRQEEVRVEQQKTELLDRLSLMEPKHRLLEVLNNTSIPLTWIPWEWLEVPYVFWTGTSSLEMTEIINLLTTRAQISRRAKSGWKNLRTRLYKIRSKIFAEEGGYPHSEHVET